MTELMEYAKQLHQILKLGKPGKFTTIQISNVSTEYKAYFR